MRSKIARAEPALRDLCRQAGLRIITTVPPDLSIPKGLLAMLHAGYLSGLWIDADEINVTFYDDQQRQYLSQAQARKLIAAFWGRD